MYQQLQIFSGCLKDQFLIIRDDIWPIKKPRLPFESGAYMSIKKDFENSVRSGSLWDDQVIFNEDDISNEEGRLKMYMKEKRRWIKLA